MEIQHSGSILKRKWSFSFKEFLVMTFDSLCSYLTKRLRGNHDQKRVFWSAKFTVCDRTYINFKP